MSNALYDFGGLRFWTEDEIELREAFQKRAVSVVRRTLLHINPAWRFCRTEGPILTPAEHVNAAYTSEDVFTTNHKDWRLRPETTASSYAVARRIGGKLPICIWQAGKSFRREQNDGASAAKLRFNEFWQLEFQCIYSDTTHADYRRALINSMWHEISRFTRQYEVRAIDSDRLPGYSESTVDIEVNYLGRWTEIASCSIRNDFGPGTKVCEIAIGLDRIATIAANELA